MRCRRGKRQALPVQPPIAARRGVRDTMVRVLLATMLTPKMASAEDESLTETLTYQERLELLINAPAEGMKEDTIVRVHEWPCILFAPNTERMAMVAGRQHCFRVWRCTFGVVFIHQLFFLMIILSLLCLLACLLLSGIHRNGYHAGHIARHLHLGHGEDR